MDEKDRENLFRKTQRKTVFINSRCLSTLDSSRFDHSLKESIFKEFPESSFAAKETVYIDILMTSRNGDRKIMQPIRITSEFTTRLRTWN